jgi:hypothetical protein
VRAALPLSLVTAMACALALAGCIGGGDDLSAAPATDGAAGDGRASDASGEGAMGDAARDAPPVDAGSAVDAKDSTVVDAGPDATLSEGGDGGSDGAGVDGGAPIAKFLPMLDFGLVNCGLQATKPFSIQNVGGGTLTISAMAVSSSALGSFEAIESSLSLGPGVTGMITIQVSASGSTAGAEIDGLLNLFTTDPKNSSVQIPLKAVTTGGTLVFQESGRTAFDLGATKVGIPAAPVDVSLVNLGNAPVTIAAIDVVAPANGFSLTSLAPLPVTINPMHTWTARAGYTPSSKGPPQNAVFNLVPPSPAGAMCGGLPSITLQGQGIAGSIGGCPTTSVTFTGDCGGAAPSPSTITLTNSGAVGAQIIDIGADAGFTLNVNAGAVIPPDGGSLNIAVTPPPFPSQAGRSPGSAMPPPITGGLTIRTDSDSNGTGCAVALTENPRGPILNFQPAASVNFATPIVLQSTPPEQQVFSVVNTGTSAPASAPPTVTLQMMGVDGGTGTGAPLPFSLQSSQFQVSAGGQQQDTVTFSPVVAGPNVAYVAMSVDQPQLLCAQLPKPLTLLGTGIGAGPRITPASLALTFDVPCDGATLPPDQTITVTNVGSADAGTLDMTLELGHITGVGAANYVIKNGPAPGVALVLHPGDQAVVTIGVKLPIASGATGVVAPTPAALAAQLPITTSVPFVNPVIALNEIPVGDQLSVSAGHMDFGAVPITQTATQTFTITNNANAGSSPANVALGVQGTGRSGYLVSPSQEVLLPGESTSPAVGVGFNPAAVGSYQASLQLSTSDPLCAPLPAGIPLSGTGTNGSPVVSSNRLVFGTDPNDSSGFVDCGTQGPAKTFTVSNQGNQSFSIAGAAYANGMTSSTYYMMYSVTDSNGATLTLPAPVAPGATVTFVVTPNPIPRTGVDPTTSLFNDTLTVTTTDNLGPVNHAIALVMRARGAVISIPQAIATTWDFGTISFGSVGTFPSLFSNAGNAPATVSLTGLASNVFGLAISPTVLAPQAVTSVVGEFTPPAADGSNWIDQGTLFLTAEAFCAAPPPGWNPVTPTTMEWQGPTVNLVGVSDSHPPVTASGSLAFPSSECGSPPPAPQTITLLNNTNQDHPFTASLQSGAHYTLTTTADAGLSTGDAGTGILPASSQATIVVTPQFVTPGQGVAAGAAPYADSLFVSVGPAGAPIWTSRISIAWSLNGAVLSVPQGDHRVNNTLFYVADTAGDFDIPIANSGNEAANVLFTIAPSADFTTAQTQPISVSVNGSRTKLYSTSGAPSCPLQFAPNETVTLTPSGPVCQPFADPTVDGGSVPGVTLQVLSCTGSF